MAMQIQRRLKSKRGIWTRREKLTVAAHEAIDDAIRHTADKFHCSEAMVAAVAFSEFFGIDPDMTTGRDTAALRSRRRRR